MIATIHSVRMNLTLPVFLGPAPSATSPIFSKQMETVAPSIFLANSGKVGDDGQVLGDKSGLIKPFPISNLTKGYIVHDAGLESSFAFFGLPLLKSNFLKLDRATETKVLTPEEEEDTKPYKALGMDDITKVSGSASGEINLDEDFKIDEMNDHNHIWSGPIKYPYLDPKWEFFVYDVYFLKIKVDPDNIYVVIAHNQEIIYIHDKLGILRMKSDNQLEIVVKNNAHFVWIMKIILCVLGI